ncbi:MAG: glycerol-3-phosphate dehydrogenase subunit C [Cryomorphaceae bacterium]|jgi:glycerol-3-phosphate dehydrogenase subunit C
MREGSLEAPTRHPLDWKNDLFWDKGNLEAELERVYDICHGCRRCVSLCDAFPTLFDLIDESSTFEVDGVDKADYMKVVDQCYLCDLCYLTKCPYVPPHEWNVDFPHLMLRAKAQDFREKGTSLRNKVLTSTDAMNKLMKIPVINQTGNALLKNKTFRSVFEKGFGVHKDAPVPEYRRKNIAKLAKNLPVRSITATPIGRTTGKLALYATCYGNYNTPDLGLDFLKVFQHNNVDIKLVPKERCCGMPKLELGDLDSVEENMKFNIPILAKLVDEGYDLVAPIPSCVLMYKQELPLMFPDNEDVIKVQKAFFDPFEYLSVRNKGGALKTDFQHELGDISYQVACHQRVQKIGHKTREVLGLVPGTMVIPIERCSGHDGTYAVKKETYDKAVKIARPVVRKVKEQAAQHFTSDCPMASAHVAKLAGDAVKSNEHPMTLLRRAYGI